MESAPQPASVLFCKKLSIYFRSFTDEFQSYTNFPSWIALYVIILNNRNMIIQYLTVALHLSRDDGNREMCAGHFDGHDGNIVDRCFSSRTVLLANLTQIKVVRGEPREMKLL